MKFKVYFILAFTLFYQYAQAQHQVSFIEEYIDFSFEDGQFGINGVYVFYNKSGLDCRNAIRFPFGLSADSVDVKHIYDLQNNRSIDYRKSGKSVFFNIYIPAKDTLRVNISYTQPRRNRNQYIITSTNAWGEPLKKALYSLTLKDDVEIDSYSYPPDSVSGNISYWRKYDFLPQKEFEVILKK